MRRPMTSERALALALAATLAVFAMTVGFVWAVAWIAGRCQ